MKTLQEILDKHYLPGHRRVTLAPRADGKVVYPANLTVDNIYRMSGIGTVGLSTIAAALAAEVAELHTCIDSMRELLGVKP